MSKALRTAGMIVGAVALIAAGVGPVAGSAALAATASSVASYATLAATALSTGAALTAKAPTNERQGLQLSFKIDPGSPIPYVIGRTATGGTIVHRETFGTDNHYQTFFVALSLGPIAGIDERLIDRASIAFSGTSALGYYNRWMWQDVQLGATPEPRALGHGITSPPFGSIPAQVPGWSGQHRLSGYAAASISLLFDTKARRYQNGEPLPAWVLRGNLVWDPRLDSTYPGGAGPCRRDDPSTWVYSETPALHGLKWRLGIFHNGKKVMGIGAPADLIDIASIVEAANVQEANGWKVGGELNSEMDRWEALKLIEEAGGAEPIPRGGRMATLQKMPRVPVGTISAADIVEARSIPAMKPRRERINGYRARFRSEAHGWEMIPIDIVQVPDYVAADGGARTGSSDFALVQIADQAGSLAAYKIFDSREIGPIELVLKPRFMGYRIGDCLAIDAIETGLSGKLLIVRGRSINPGTGEVTMRFETETPEKHATALGQTGAVPPVPTLTFDPDIPAAPAAADWQVEGGVWRDGEYREPAIFLVGAVGNSNAENVVFEVRLASGGDWFLPSIEPAGTTTKVIRGLLSETAYDVAVSYKVRGVIGDRRVLGPVLTGKAPNAVYDDGRPIEDLKPAQPGADVTGDNTAKDTVSVGGRPAADLVSWLDARPGVEERIEELTGAIGDAGSIAEQVDAARGYAEASATARDQSWAARDAVQAAGALATGKATEADQAKLGAEAALGATTTARDAAIANAQAAAQSKSDASGFASAASGKATIATQKADEAGQKASIATAQADIATTKAGEASVSRNQAAISESNSAGSASSAATSAGVSASAKQAIIAIDGNWNFDLGLEGWSNVASAYVEPSFAGRKNVLRTAPGVRIDMIQGSKVSITSAEQLFELRTAYGAGGPSYSNVMLYVGVIFYDASDNLVVGSDGTGNYPLAAAANLNPQANGWVEVTAVIGKQASGQSITNPNGAPTGTTTIPAEATYFRPVIFLNYQNNPDNFGAVDYLTVADVTDRVRSNQFAAASATSASTASAKATEAGQSAIAASAERIAAETARGQAESFRNQAATSDSNAAGSASSAATSAGVSASARDSAVKVVANTLPPSFTADNRFWSSFYDGPIDRSANFSNDYIFFDGSMILNASEDKSYDVAHRGLIPLVPGRRRRLTSVWRVNYANNIAAPVGSDIFFIGTNSSGTAIYTPGASPTIPVGGEGWGSNSWQVSTFEFLDNDLISAGCSHVRGLHRFKPRAGQQFALQSLTIEDVTSEQNAAIQASAAATSASSAAASNDQAGQRASAAQEARIAAETARGQSETFSGQAASSATSAAGSKSLAAGSANYAASVGASRGLTRNGMFQADFRGWSVSGMNWSPTLFRGAGFRADRGVSGSLGSADMKQVDTSRVYRLNCQIVNHGPAASMVYAGLTCFDANKSFVGVVYMPQFIWNGSPIAPAYNVYKRTNEYTGEYGTAPVFTHGSFFPTGTVYVQETAYLNYPDPNAPDAATEINWLYLEDITEEVAARGSASAAASSASSASASSGEAGNSANSASQSANSANAANGQAQAAAGVAQSAAAAASASEASARQSTSLSARYAGGGFVSNPRFQDWPSNSDGAQIPSNWSLWVQEGNSVQERFTDVGNDGSIVTGGARPFLAQRVNADGHSVGVYQQFKAGAGRYSAKATARLYAGPWYGAGLLIYCLDANSNLLSGGSHTINFWSDPTTNGMTGSQIGADGTKVWNWEKAFTAPVGTDIIRVYAMGNWPGGFFGDTGRSKTIGWENVSVETSDLLQKGLADIAANSAAISSEAATRATADGALGTRIDSVTARAGSLEASVSVQASAIAGLQDKTGAFWRVVGTTPDGRFIIAGVVDENGSAIALGADSIVLGNQQTFVVENGRAAIKGDLYMVGGNIIIVGTTHMRVLGKGFGVGGELIEWWGPIMQVAQCSKQNGLSWKTINGMAYETGFSVGRLTNGNTTPSLAADASIATPVFGSNGGVIQVSPAWYWALTQTTTYAATPAGRNDFIAAAQAAGAVAQGGGVWAGNSTINVGTSTLTLRKNGAVLTSQSASTAQRRANGYEPVPGGDVTGSLTVSLNVQIAFTTNDPVQSADSRSFSAHLSRASDLSGATEQRVSIATIE